MIKIPKKPKIHPITFVKESFSNRNNKLATSNAKKALVPEMIEPLTPLVLSLIHIWAGAGTNNIDIKTCTEKGIVVFNTPGANSNAVKEIVFAGMLLASRDIYGGIAWAKTQENNENLAKDMEKQKKKYAGTELNGKTLGVIGCGAIGVQVANLALRFGMKVRGYDPYMSIEAAWNLSRYVKHDSDVKDLYKNSDFITIHIPLNDKTKDTINKETIALMKDGVKILKMCIRDSYSANFLTIIISVIRVRNLIRKKFHEQRLR